VVTRTSSKPAEIARPDTEPGANIVGFFKAEFGHGEAARRIAAAIERAGIP